MEAEREVESMRGFAKRPWILIVDFPLVLPLAKCIDKYIALRVQEYQDPQNAEPLDPRLKDVVEKMFTRCYQDGEFKQVRPRHPETLPIGALLSLSLTAFRILHFILTGCWYCFGGAPLGRRGILDQDWWTL